MSLNKEEKNNNLYRIYVVLDNIRSAQNVGSFFRTCDSLGVDKIFLCGITSVPPNKEILKTALGATDSVKWEYFENTLHCIDFLKSEDYIVICVEQTEKSLMLDKYNFNINKNICLVFGNEIEGVGKEIIEMADECVEIPQLGTKHSLNVSVAGGIVIWDLLRSKIKSKP
ncbi:MAG: RNA methyltransferase [Bacteroidia bacterium]|nr:RNA methyltransferase [Bacteroidia bacterium]